MVKLENLDFVIKQGILPEKALQVARQVEACARAGIGATITDTWEAWKRVNLPTEVRNRVVGSDHA